MATKKDVSGRFGLQHLDGTAQALAVTRSHGWKRRSVRTRLAKRQIAMQNQITGAGESICQGDQ
jgi:hypothetical protein